MDCIEAVARQLSEIKLRKDRTANENAWAMARVYHQSYNDMAEELDQMGIKPSPKTVVNALRGVSGYEGPAHKWLTNAKRTLDTFTDLAFDVRDEDLPLTFEMYKQIANSALPNKHEVRYWAENHEHLTHVELRERIRQIQGNDPMRPDFDLKVSNHWKFSDKTQPNGFDGGIHPAIIANLLYYCTDPGDMVIDPMAGSGITADVLKYYTFFHESELGKPFGGSRHILMSDLKPTRLDIVQADATIALPWPDDCADFAIIDPPYWKIAEGKYHYMGETADQWRMGMRAVLTNCIRVIRDGGQIAVIVDDYMRKDGYHPLSTYVAIEAYGLGLLPGGTFYNAYPHFVTTMGPIEMWRAKRARLAVNEMKIIQVFIVDKS